MIYNEMRRTPLLLLAKQRGFRFPEHPTRRFLTVMFEEIDTANEILERYSEFKVAVVAVADMSFNELRALAKQHGIKPGTKAHFIKSLEGKI